MKKTIGVKDIAINLYSSGDLTNEFFSNHDLKEGKAAHVFLQSKYNEKSIKEFYIKREIEKDNNLIIVTGFIDGVLNIDGSIIIEEIKSTKVELDELDLNYHKEYFAQLKLYGYMYGIEKGFSQVDLRLTYISLINYETKSLNITLSLNELEDFFFKSVDSYLTWLSIVNDSLEKKIKTIKEIKFPFEELRVGQKELMKACFEAMKNKDILYVIAPTGIGKTIATIFSSLKTMEKETDKLFYLTAKGMGKTVAIDSVKLLEKNGLQMKTIVITSKSKSCLNSVKNCNPDKCIYALGFFERLNAATKDIFTKCDIYDYDTINEYALKHQICAFEFSLYLSYFCDFVIADYNYVFDPRAHLIRYFEDDTYHPKILVDEAHNLISRSKDMYSAEIGTKNLKNLRRFMTSVKPSIRNEINKTIDYIESYEEKIKPSVIFFQNEMDSNIVALLKRITNKMETILENQKEFKNREEALEEYYIILDFLRISEFYSSSHRFLVKKNEDEYNLSITCLDASEFILETINDHCYGTVFFSATMYPIRYHMDLLTKNKGKAIILNSSFPIDNLFVGIKDNVSTKYRNRLESIEDIIVSIDTLVHSNPGNYIVFFPSYSYMEMITSSLGDKDYNYFIQKNNMTDIERNEYFDRFKTNEPKVGFFVLGGVFAEGLDYVGDLLSGVIIVGVGLPQVCVENDLLKEYFIEKEMPGFDYAYTYPGFNKVVQAAGRVIRSETDFGVVILIDERYRYQIYQELMPLSWSKRKRVNKNYELKKSLLEFWENKKA